MESNLSKNVAGTGTRQVGFGSAVRAIVLAGATLTTGLIAGLFYTFAVSVDLGLAEQPDASYVATVNATNERILNPLFYASFLGAVLFLVVTLAVHLPRSQRGSGRFRLVALACALYIGGGFLLTMTVNMPMNDQLAAVDSDAPARVLAEARAAYEGPWDFWNGVRAGFSTLAFLALIGACLLGDGSPRPRQRTR